MCMKNNICSISNCQNIIKRGTICGTHRWRKKKFNSYDLPSYTGVPNYAIIPKLPEGIVKNCKNCGYLNADQCYNRMGYKYKHRSYTCKRCVRNGNIKREYPTMDGMNHYEEMLKYQNNKCKICHKESQKMSNNSKTFKSLAIDHRHSDGKIRGLLCDHCNQGLGHFFDNPETLQSAIDYLKSYQ